ATRASSEELGAAERRIGQKITESGMSLQSAFDTALSRTKTELELAAEKRHQETQARIQALKEAQERDQRDAAARHAEVTASIAEVRSDVTTGFAAVAQRDAQRSEADKARDQRLEAMHGILTRLDERSQQRMDVFALLGAHLRKSKDTPVLAGAHRTERTDAA
ncbi:MAG TPA: hypothetical protein VFF04_04470, partial [Candidatus Babeliales bacterium]|nr:hypothetical protein [Candidatus Babeliales bacterium]